MNRHCITLALFTLTACGGSLPHFHTDGLKKIALGDPKERVQELIGRPQHVWLLDDDVSNKKHCAERWTWQNYSMGWVTANIQALTVDFDQAGRTCEILPAPN